MQTQKKMNRITGPVTLFLAFIFLLVKSVSGQNANKNIIQVDLKKILNARPVSVLTKNKLITWMKGIDGNGLADGYLTRAAALFNGDVDPHALPDNAQIPANEEHPQINLHYSNNDGRQNQAFSFNGADSMLFDVPVKKYLQLFLALTSAEGLSEIQVTLIYSEGKEVKSFIVPDYYADIPKTDPNFCYLLHDLAKWGNKNNMTEKDHHNIDLLKIVTDGNKKLKQIKISKTKPGYLVFWAAVGVY